MATPRYFVSTIYTRDGEGLFIPTIPEFGPCRSRDECEIVFHHCRERKTGPCFPVTVVYCLKHEVSFTLYPPGHVPYGRITLSGLALNRSILEKGRAPPFRNTYFDAALDAAQGVAWPRKSDEGSIELRFITQFRHIERCRLLFGLDQDSRAREAVAEQLDIGGFILEEGRKQLVNEANFRTPGKVICLILDKLPENHTTFQRLATCGHYAGIWKQIQCWDECHY